MLQNNENKFSLYFFLQIRNNESGTFLSRGGLEALEF